MAVQTPTHGAESNGKDQVCVVLFPKQVYTLTGSPSGGATYKAFIRTVGFRRCGFWIRVYSNPGAGAAVFNRFWLLDLDDAQEQGGGNPILNPGAAPIGVDFYPTTVTSPAEAYLNSLEVDLVISTGSVEVAAGIILHPTVTV